MTATEAMERTASNEGKASRSGSEARAHDQRASAADDARRTPNKKRRKVNHGKFGGVLVYSLPLRDPKLTCPSRSLQPVSTADDL